MGVKLVELSVADVFLLVLIILALFSYIFALVLSLAITVIFNYFPSKPQTSLVMIVQQVS
jgi:hypothetical protein